MSNPKVVLRPCPVYDPATVRAALISVLEPIGGLDWVTPGMKIGIKTNLISALKPDRAATTHPVLLGELAGLLHERGAEVTIGDSPGGVYNRLFVERVYEVCGLTGLEREGIRLNRDFGQKERDFPDGKVLKNFIYTSWLDDQDVLINFSKLKVHAMMGMTAATKNLFGTIPGAVKPEYHYRFPAYEDFADMLVDLNECFRPRLNICDAVVAMEGNGPTQGTPKQIGVLLASASPYALDLAAADLIGLQKEDVPYLQAAFLRGRIPGKADELEIDGDPNDFRPEDFLLIRTRDPLTRLVSGNGGPARLIRAVAEDLLRARPKPDTSLCVGCGICAKACPASAIQIVNKLPEIDRKACIRCFCCQELCPRGAMRLHRPLAARIIGKL